MESTLTGYHMDVHRNWLMLRRHQLLQQLGEDEVASGDGELPWTVGVLLTPRPDGTRLWDTTIAATNARPDLKPAQLESLVGIFGALGTEGSTLRPREPGPEAVIRHTEPGSGRHRN